MGKKKMINISNRSRTTIHMTCIIGTVYVYARVNVHNISYTVHYDRGGYYIVVPCGHVRASGVTRASVGHGCKSDHKQQRANSRSSLPPPWPSHYTIGCSRI